MSFEADSALQCQRRYKKVLFCIALQRTMPVAVFHMYLANTSFLPLVYIFKMNFVVLYTQMLPSTWLTKSIIIIRLVWRLKAKSFHFKSFKLFSTINHFQMRIYKNKQFIITSVLLYSLSIYLLNVYWHHPLSKTSSINLWIIFIILQIWIV